MGQRGPSRTPTNLLKMRGSRRAKARQGEPAPSPDRPRCPAWLSKEAKREWRGVTRRLDAIGLLSDTDRAVLTRYADLLAEWRRCREWLAVHGDTYPVKDKAGAVIAIKVFPQVRRTQRLAEHLLRIEREFGLTPSRRAGLSVAQPSTEAGGKDRFLAQELPGAPRRAAACRPTGQPKTQSRFSQADTPR